MREFAKAAFIPVVAIAAMVRESYVEGEPGLAMGIAALLIAGFLLFLELGKVTKDKNRNLG